MQFMYGNANGSATQAVRFYQIRIPNRALPDRRTIHIQQNNRQISETGSFCSERQDTGRRPSTRTTNRGETIWEAEDNQLNEAHDQ